MGFDNFFPGSQAFVVFLPVKSVGVVGDARRYEYVVSLRAVETIGFMAARWAHLPYDFLELVSNCIINEISGISRVAYNISSKPPATIEWERIPTCRSQATDQHTNSVTLKSHRARFGSACED